MQNQQLKLVTSYTVIFPVVLYGRETLCLSLREEYRLTVFENRKLRGVFGPVGKQIT
jgi:hypothetical protein